VNILIVEDEKIAARHLKKLLVELLPESEIVGFTDTVKSTIDWFKNHPSPDLSFFDIRLADGISFDVFSAVEVNCPVIFTTAYDEYALQAFEVNSIDYLLKPVESAKLEKALRKYSRLKAGGEQSPIDPGILLNALDYLAGKKYKERFVVKFGDHLKSIPASEIACFMSDLKTTFLLTADKRKHIVDFTLDQIGEMVDPREFFRINRKFIVRMKSIRDIIAWSNSRLKIVLQDFDHPDLVVAREKVQEFRKWLGE
jgi:DNA-binding LytR/AlgR family response regulator